MHIDHILLKAGFQWPGRCFLTLISLSVVFTDCPNHSSRSDWTSDQPVISCGWAEQPGDFFCDFNSQSNVHCALWHQTCERQSFHCYISSASPVFPDLWPWCLSQGLICYKPVDTGSCFLRKMEQYDYDNVRSILQESTHKVTVSDVSVVLCYASLHSRYTRNMTPRGSTTWCTWPN